MNRSTVLYLATRLFCVSVLILMSIVSLTGDVKTASGNPETSAIRDLPGFRTYSLPANDDGSTDLVSIGFLLNFYGIQHDVAYVNNNGNITFDQPLPTYTPFDLTSTNREILAPFFGDVDTRGFGSDLVTYGQDTVDGHSAFGVNWFNVGYYHSHADKLNSFQLILIDRSDIQPGDFDIEFNYSTIQWETGDASGGSGGVGGYSARVGYSNGTRQPGTFFELPGSAINGAFLDSNPVTGLIYNSFNDIVVGRYRFEARNGSIITEHNPLIFLPGATGSVMENDPNSDNVYSEVWPNACELLTDLDDDSLLVLRLDSNGAGPYTTTDPAYTSVRVGDVMRTARCGPIGDDPYLATIQYFTQTRGYIEGQDFFVCPYDWRKGVPEIASGVLVKTLDKCVNQALATNPNSAKVDILAHSMGGLVARYYLADPLRAQKVENLVTLGTPYLGAPQIAIAIIDKLCFVEPHGICLTDPTTLSQLVTNFPSAYQIAPSDAYFQVYNQGYIYRAWDKDSNGSIDGFLNANDSFDMLARDNAVLTESARDYHALVGGWSNGGTNGVNVLMVMGSGLGTPMIIYEKQRTPWYNPWGTEIYYEMVMGNGDGTVPLYSAMMRNPYTGVDLSNNVPKVYFNLEHGELPKNLQVLQVVASVFESTLYPNLINRGQPSDFSSSNSDDPSLEPIPLDGQQITVEGPVKVEITDSAGNYIGEIENGGATQIDIPGASFYQDSGTTTIFLSNDSLYQIKVLGQDNSPTDIRFHRIVSDTLVDLTVYENLSTAQTSVSTLQFDPTTSNSSDFQIDIDGDGTYDELGVVSQILTPAESQDYEAPVTTIQVTGTPSDDGWYTGEIAVEMYATDNSGGAGVAEIEYSLDNGQIWFKYTGPILVNADEINLILAKATDRASNEETPLSYVGYLLTHRVYLPLVGRSSPPSTAFVTSIAAGADYNCALMSQGGIKCWGANIYGQLGDGTTISRTAPVDVVGLNANVVAITTGNTHACALTTSGGVKCWGDNEDGQLGDGTLISHLTPVDVNGLTSGVVAISAGGSSTCALTISGGVKCWGNNLYGQLGDDSTINRSLPTNVSTLTSGVLAIGAGGGHTCAITTGGGVKCWGGNWNGQLGDGTTTNRTVPVDVSGLLNGITTIVGGHTSGVTCALTTSGGAKCWGHNYSGQLGDGSNISRYTPVDVVGLTSGVVSVNTSGGHTCAITDNQELKCWGGNGWWQLGDGTTIDRNIPVLVNGLNGVNEVATGRLHSCALTPGGVKCWGFNYSGQLGDGTRTARSVPVSVIGLSGPPTQPDLVSSFSLSVPNPSAGQPVVISVVITNTGTASTSNFWVDFYINPSFPPTQANQTWDTRCGMTPCYGIAWYVTQTLLPGQSVTLTSSADSYIPEYTRWPGYFAAGTTDLYLYVDSYSEEGLTSGAVLESNEGNNRAEQHGLNLTGINAVDDGLAPNELLPPRSK